MTDLADRWPEIVGTATTLGATFVGAWLAFRYQNIHDKARESEERIAAGNRALITLLHQLNGLYLYQLDFINPHRDSPARHIGIPPVLPFDESALTYDLRDLSFLVSEGYPKALTTLLLEENRYREAVVAINQRSRHHFEVVQPRLEKAGIKEKTPYTEQDFIRAIGERDYKHLQRLTDAIIRLVDRNITSLLAAKNELRDALKAIFPKTKFIDLELDPNPPRSIHAQ